MHNSPLSFIPSITDFIRFSEAALNNTKLNICLKTLSLNKLQAETSIMFRLEPPSNATCCTGATPLFVYIRFQQVTCCAFFSADWRPFINRWPICCMRRTYEYAGANEPVTAVALLRRLWTKGHSLFYSKTSWALSNGVGIYDFKTQIMIHDVMSCDYCFYPKSFTLLEFVMCI